MCFPLETSRCALVAKAFHCENTFLTVRKLILSSLLKIKGAREEFLKEEIEACKLSKMKIKFLSHYIFPAHRQKPFSNRAQKN